MASGVDSDGSFSGDDDSSSTIDSFPVVSPVVAASTAITPSDSDPKIFLAFSGIRPEGEGTFVVLVVGVDVGFRVSPGVLNPTSCSVGVGVGFRVSPGILNPSLSGVGEAVGELVGAVVVCIGAVVGEDVGRFVDSSMGVSDGILVGVLLSRSFVGGLVAFVVGRRVGVSVGILVGDFVGFVVGFVVGLSVGGRVGSFDGTLVGGFVGGLFVREPVGSLDGVLVGVRGRTGVNVKSVRMISSLSRTPSTGDLIGLSTGATVGSLLGFDEDGILVLTGNLVAITVGSFVGSLVCRSVGERLGKEVGIAETVGLDEGATVAQGISESKSTGHAFIN